MAFKASTTTNYASLFTDVIALLENISFMGYSLVVGSVSGTFALGETVTFSGGATAIAREATDLGGGSAALVVDTGTGTVAPAQTLTGGTSGATATVTTADSRAWTSVVSVTGQQALKNTGAAPGDEVWITLELYQVGTTAGIWFGGALGYDATVGGWAGLALIGSGIAGGGAAFLSLPNSGVPTRDAIKYWLVADTKRIILAVHLEYLLGGGVCTWAHSGFLTRWDPPSQYPSPHVVSGPYGSPIIYTTTANSLGFGGSGSAGDKVVFIHPIFQNFSFNFFVIKAEPGMANSDASHSIMPMWCHGSIQSGAFHMYLGEIDGLFYTDVNVGLGNTFTPGDGGDYVTLQNFGPGHYAALRLW